MFLSIHSFAPPLLKDLIYKGKSINEVNDYKHVLHMHRTILRCASGTD